MSGNFVGGGRILSWQNLQKQMAMRTACDDYKTGQRFSMPPSAEYEDQNPRHGSAVCGYWYEKWTTTTFMNRTMFPSRVPNAQSRITRQQKLKYQGQVVELKKGFVEY